ncbi:solute:Na+ symporter, SSS family [Sporolituus thermophilus DSM 23256]|uniref:Solute:Na+ symporter, SSS family n=2 Tax=Sporolituus TaxID=909931 RepID=A0A1G7MAV3_9FIRM|nr:solute:Na+ symporter, SSS family [Sporolituus thermophilus DSM 23256]
MLHLRAGGKGMLLSPVHMIGLLVTLTAVTVTGLYAARKVRNAADFAVGGHKSGVTMIAGTIIGTIIGGASTVGTAQLAFTVGLSAWWFTLGTGIALLVMGLFYAAPLRKSNLQTMPQYLAISYGPLAGPLTSLASSIGIFFSIVSSILAAVPIISAIFQIDAAYAAGIVFFLIVVYVFFGGVWGTGLIGTLKTVLIYITLVAVGALTYTGMGGVTGFLQAFPADPWLNLVGRGLWADLGSALSLLVGTISTQTYIQAIYAARDIQAARRGAVVAALITLPAGIPAVMAGMYMRVHHPTIAPIDALPLFILYYLPPWLGGVAIAALLLAAIGSAAGLALGVATMLSRDILSEVWGISGDRRLLWANRIAVLGVTLLATLFTFGNLKSLVLEWNFLSMGLRGAGIFLPLTAAVFWPGRIGPAYAIWSMAGGAGAALLWKILFPSGIDPLYAGLGVNALMLAAGAVARQPGKMAGEP